MKIVINPDKLVPTQSMQNFRKARVILENDKGQFAISNEGGKCIFPGGKCEKGETGVQAIQRELEEETGISLKESDFTEILELETLYKDFYDYRSNSFKLRLTNTIYYYARCSDKINTDNMNLTIGEINENFTIVFVDKEQLLRLLLVDHSSAINGKFFDEENRIVVQQILQRKKSNKIKIHDEER